MKNKITWTVMIYMAGDNNLSIDMAYALEELQKKVIVNDTDKINLFVHYVNNSPEIPSIYCDFSDSENPIFQNSVEIENKFSSQEINKTEDFGGVNPVIDFVDWCVQRKHTTSIDKNDDKYILIFSGHTMGFFSMGLLKDESNDLSMTMPNLQKGLETITDKITGKKLSLLGFDSCVMSMFEVGQQFKTISETMIASEGSIPNAGWAYAEILRNLTSQNTDIKHIAGEYVYDYIEKQSNYSIGGVSVDMAAWDLNNLDDLTEKFEKFAESLIKCFKDENSVIYKQMRRILLQTHFDCQTYMFEQNIDLGDFCSLLIEEIKSLKFESNGNINTDITNVLECSKDVIAEINNCIILSGYSGGEYQYSTGISMFFPWSLSAYSVSVNDYQELDFIQNTNAGRAWNKFLQKYLSEVSLRKAVDSNVDNSLELKEIQNANNKQEFVVGQNSN